jgi:hypothetical protein
MKSAAVAFGIALLMTSCAAMACGNSDTSLAEQFTFSAACDGNCQGPVTNDVANNDVTSDDVTSDDVAKGDVTKDDFTKDLAKGCDTDCVDNLADESVAVCSTEDCATETFTGSINDPKSDPNADAALDCGITAGCVIVPALQDLSSENISDAITDEAAVKDEAAVTDKAAATDEAAIADEAAAKDETAATDETASLAVGCGSDNCAQASVGDTGTACGTEDECAVKMSSEAVVTCGDDISCLTETSTAADACGTNPCGIATGEVAADPVSACDGACNAGPTEATEVADSVVTGNEPSILSCSVDRGCDSAEEAVIVPACAADNGCETAPATNATSIEDVAPVLACSSADCATDGANAAPEELGSDQNGLATDAVAAVDLR